MKAQEIRDRFIKYFSDKGHQYVSSSPLVPHNDATLLFANAGMNQFKNYFTGIEKPKFKRAVSIQKCVRAGGKHNDLENVGRTARHHTFFEMLGNFSFGDYFKEEAIKYAWEFLTKTLAIPTHKLYVTVHHTDDEAFEIWNKKIGIAEERIFKKGDKDNFWSMGDVGPCGPCSEIFYDHGEQHATPGFKPAADQDILDDELRYVEIWNLVFMQFEQTDTERKPLPNPSIDTGAGLERIAAALQNVYWNYDTDLFANLISQIEKLTGTSYNDKKYSTSIRVVADHVRSCSMLISDGVLPSNEGKGYVLRRIIRRATRHLKNLNAPNNSLAKLSALLFDEMKQQYPENYANKQLALEMLEVEENKFLETLENGLKYLQNAIEENTNSKVFSGKAAFRLYDTFGFPLDLTESILEEKGISINISEFETEMQKRKAESKSSWKGSFNFDEKKFYDLKEKFGETHFIGYSTTNKECKLLHSIELSKGKFGLIFDQTPFYGESGGQVGDTGYIINEGNQISIIDTIKPIPDFIVHISEKAPTQMSIGSSFQLIVESRERELTARNHTATHLLHKVLAETLGSHVKQAGSFVSSDKLRFDYTHMKAPSADELKTIEDKVNLLIQKRLDVTTSVCSYDQAIDQGAMALFGEKYGDEVRVINISGESIELCGGTHVNNTNEISYFKVISEGALSSGIRRIEALTSTTAIEYLNQRSNYLYQLEAILKDKAENLTTKVKKLNQDIKNKNKEISKLQDKLNSKSSDDIFTNPTKLTNGIVFKSALAPEGANLRDLSDIFINKNPEGFLFLYSGTTPQSTILLRRGRKTNEINLNKIVKDLNGLGNIKGGGRPDMVQGKADQNATADLSKAISQLLAKY